MRTTAPSLLLILALLAGCKSGHPPVRGVHGVHMEREVVCARCGERSSVRDEVHGQRGPQRLPMVGTREPDALRMGGPRAMERPFEVRVHGGPGAFGPRMAERRGPGQRGPWMRMRGVPDLRAPFDRSMRGDPSGNTERREHAPRGERSPRRRGEQQTPRDERGAREKRARPGRGVVEGPAALAPESARSAPLRVRRVRIGEPRAGVSPDGADTFAPRAEVRGRVIELPRLRRRPDARFESRVPERLDAPVEAPRDSEPEPRLDPR